ncbi:MAG: zinc-dependent alcohol dehydrogenase family protein [Desulfobacteraceae bacterium]|nr:zinc-dependent alcohol dehydrogenase family protein [Desulfobacteraceae bacterium]
MKAMILEKICDLTKDLTPLKMADLPVPEPGPKEVLIKVSACGVCHTELDEIEGRTPPSVFPMVLGHQVVGKVVKKGDEAHQFPMGQRLGVAWIYGACGQCEWCRKGQDNLCPDFLATGRDVHGGYAEYMKVSEGFAYPIPDLFSNEEAAPLLCAGAIGYRSLSFANVKNGDHLGLTGFGASAHLVLKMVQKKYPESQVYVFARNPKEREFAKTLGAFWTGDISEKSPRKLHSIIDTTPVWKPMVEALKNLAPGGRLVINAIRKEDKDKNCLLDLDYPRHLWMEKQIKSVANVARHDVRSFLDLAAAIPIKPQVETFTLEQANQAILELKTGEIRGAKVIVF